MTWTGGFSATIKVKLTSDEEAAETLNVKVPTSMDGSRLRVDPLSLEFSGSAGVNVAPERYSTVYDLRHDPENENNEDNSTETTG